MSFRHFAALLAASALASPALAAGPGSTNDDVQYPNVAATFAPGTYEGALDTGDVIYPETHLTVVTTPRPASEDVIASFDDTAYPTADAPAQQAPPAARVATRDDVATHVACHCPGR